MQSETEKKPGILNWNNTYSGLLLSSEAKKFLNKVFENTGKYPTKTSTEKEKQYHVRECNVIFPNISERKGCCSNVAVFTKDENLCQKEDGLCFFDVAVAKNDPFICEKINSKDESYLITSKNCKQWFKKIDKKVKFVVWLKKLV